MPRQFQGVPLEGLGVGPPRIGEVDLHLADHPTGLAGDAWDREDNGGGAAADGQRPEPPLDLSLGPNVPRAARLAPEVLGSCRMVKTTWPPWYSVRTYS